MADQQIVKRITEMACRMRQEAIELAHLAGPNGAHLGGGLSSIEILAVLYGYAMEISPNKKDDPTRDRFLLSKGHGTLAYYTALYEAGFIDKKTLYTFETDGGPLAGHPIKNPALGIECSSGSLGMCFSIAVGLALSAKLHSRTNHIYTLLGDGECNEGSVWEAAMSAIGFGLHNITAIVDVNCLQSDGACASVMPTAPLEQMWHGFGWHPIIADGHNVAALCDAMDQSRNTPEPCVILAQTTKGKGVSFMEGKREWHHGVMTEQQYAQAQKEVCHV